MTIEFRANMIERGNDYTLFEPVFRASMTKAQLLALESDIQVALYKYDLEGDEDE